MGQNVQSIVRDNTACVKKRFHQQQMAKTFSARAWTLIKTSARMWERRSYLATCSPDSEFEDWMDDTVEVDDSLTLLRLWMSAIWSDSSSRRRRRYLDIKVIFLVVFSAWLFFSYFPFFDRRTYLTSAPYADSLAPSNSCDRDLPSSRKLDLIRNAKFNWVLIFSNVFSIITLMKCLALLSRPRVVCRELSLPTGT